MIAVFGGTGFIGSRLVEVLRERGEDVVAITHNRERARTKGFRFGDMLRPETLGAAVDGVEVVVQTATFPGYPLEQPRRGWTFERFDGEGTERLVAASGAAGVKRYVYVTGVGADVPNPRSHHLAILRGEQTVRSSGMEWACLRPSAVYGPTDRRLNVLLDVARVLPVIALPGLDALHEPVFIDDVAQALRQLCALGAPQGVFEAVGPERMTMREMFATLFRVAGVRCRVRALPEAPLRLGARLVDRLPLGISAASALTFACEDFTGDSRSLREQIEMTQTPFEEGLRTYLPRSQAR
jgi:NADH dehydrogenase